jgi:molybdenum cofactor cytidylyltransferase
MRSTYQAIVLAAGRSSRFGGGKLLVEWRGKPLVFAAVETALATDVDEVLVVLGCDSDLLEQALVPLATPRLRTIVAEDWAEGLSVSLKAGVRALPQGSAGTLLLLGDMPLVPLEIARGVLSVLQHENKPVQPWWQSVPGHPVGLPASYYCRLLRMGGDSGAARLLRGDPDVVKLQSKHPGTAFDIDCPADLRSRGASSWAVRCA